MKIPFDTILYNECKNAVKSILQNHGLRTDRIELEIDIHSKGTSNRPEKALIDLKAGQPPNHISYLTERIKLAVIEFVHAQEELPKTNLSVYLSEKLHYSYTYLANVFSHTKGTSIERFYLTQKIEKAKELIIYNNFRIGEVASILNYSSASHLTNQFKKITGMTPSHYKNLRLKSRNKIRNV